MADKTTIIAAPRGALPTVVTGTPAAVTAVGFMLFFSSTIDDNKLELRGEVVRFVEGKPWNMVVLMIAGYLIASAMSTFVSARAHSVMSDEAYPRRNKIVAVVEIVIAVAVAAILLFVDLLVMTVVFWALLIAFTVILPSFLAIRDIEKNSTVTVSKRE